MYRDDDLSAGNDVAQECEGSPGQLWGLHSAGEAGLWGCRRSAVGRVPCAVHVSLTTVLFLYHHTAGGIWNSGWAKTLQYFGLCLEKQHPS